MIVYSLGHLGLLVGHSIPVITLGPCCFPAIVSLVNLRVQYESNVYWTLL